MALRHINTKNGLIVLPTGANGVFTSFEVDETMASDDVTVYGSGLVYGAFLTNGTPVQRVTATGFTQNGAASSSPGFGAMTAAAGGTATLTYDTGTTLAGTYTTSRIRTSHSRARAGCPTTWELMNSGDITATWSAS